MGVFDKLINFGGNLRGKIISWVVVLVGTGVFFTGVIMTNMNAGGEIVNSISLSASNMEFHPVIFDNLGFNYAGYHMEMTTLSAHISVATDPMDTSEPVIFTTSSPLIEIAESLVTPGSVAIIRLKKVNGAYGFSNPDPTEMRDLPRINVKCGKGGASAVIFVRIILAENDVRVTATLEQQIPYVGDDWFPVNHINMYYFNNYDQVNFYAVKYRVRIRVFIYEEPVIDTGAVSFYMDAAQNYYAYSQIRDVYSNFRYQETGVENTFKGTYEQSDGGEESFTKTLQLFRGQPFGTELVTNSEKYHVISEYIQDPLKVYFRISYRLQHGAVPTDYTDYFTKSDFVVNVLSYDPNI